MIKKIAAPALGGKTKQGTKLLHVTYNTIKNTAKSSLQLWCSAHSEVRYE